VHPIPLPPNVLRHFYAGGERIAALRGLAPHDHTPEEWLGAANTTFDGSRGLSRLADGTLLRDAIAADPEAFLGPEHVARFGTDTALLVKLLDAGQRLPVHFHPDGAFARESLGSEHGKTEAWLIVEADPGASVWVGFTREIELDQVRRWMSEQDSAAMLAAMRELPVAAGDAIFVPAGTAHAIGDGVLIVELQEPTDMSVLLEWDGFGIADEDEATLGLGWDVALGAVETAARDAAPLRGPGPDGSEPVARLLPEAADDFFRADRLAPAPIAALDRGFAILIAIEGEGALLPESGEALVVRRGDAVLVPWASGACHVEGDLVAIACRPPAPPERGAH